MMDNYDSILYGEEERSDELSGKIDLYQMCLKCISDCERRSREMRDTTEKLNTVYVNHLKSRTFESVIGDINRNTSILKLF